MRLLIVTQYFWPEDFRINDLAVELSRRGHEVTVLTGVPNYPDGRVFPAFRSNPRNYDRLEDVRIVRVPLIARGKSGIRLVANYFSFAANGCLFGMWGLRGLEFDAIFTCQLSPITIGIPAAFMRAVKKAPMALWVLDLWPETLRALGAVRSPSILAAIGRLVSAIYDRCDLILAQSRSFVPQIEARCGNHARRVEYFPSWAESIFDSDGESPAGELPAKDGKFDIMFAGNIGDAQDFPAILAAAERLKGHPQIRWLIVGDGRAADWVSEEIVRRGLQNSMLMLGRHPLERMPAFYRGADALLVTLKDEPIFAMTIPGKLQTYLVAGLPILGMLNGEGARALEAAGAGFACAAGDDEALSLAVLAIAGMTKEERQSMGARGRAYGRAEFGREMLIDRLEQRLTHLAKLPP
jgi:glycosyltransferase involved in cell wall biosynthesis